MFKIGQWHNIRIRIIISFKFSVQSWNHDCRPCRIGSSQSDWGIGHSILHVHVWHRKSDAAKRPPHGVLRITENNHNQQRPNWYRFTDHNHWSLIKRLIDSLIVTNWLIAIQQYGTWKKRHWQWQCMAIAISLTLDLISQMNSQRLSDSEWIVRSRVRQSVNQSQSQSVAVIVIVIVVIVIVRVRVIVFVRLAECKQETPACVPEHQQRSLTLQLFGVGEARPQRPSSFGTKSLHFLTTWNKQRFQNLQC